uniref:Uncharacterized protein n=1 Tax=Rhizophora mucronata TaxID=61149 RepID=A0A2P2IXU9_RHIMU
MMHPFIAEKNRGSINCIPNQLQRIRNKKNLVWIMCLAVLWSILNLMQGVTPLTAAKESWATDSTELPTVVMLLVGKQLDVAHRKE